MNWASEFWFNPIIPVSENQRPHSPKLSCMDISRLCQLFSGIPLSFSSQLCRFFIVFIFECLSEAMLTFNVCLMLLWRVIQLCFPIVEQQI
jgi:hypothetical protein